MKVLGPQHGPQMAPRGLQDGPRWPQDGPKMAPSWAKIAIRVKKISDESSKVVIRAKMYKNNKKTIGSYRFVTKCSMQREYRPRRG